MRRLALLLALALALAACGGHDASRHALLWPTGAPGAKGDGKGDTPELWVYLPPPDKATGVAVIVAPGGSYAHTGGLRVEAFPAARWFVERGITAVVLRYRVVNDDYHHTEVLPDDLLSAGLGLAGLRTPLAPAPADAAAPTAQELRRRAIHANWRGIADLTGAQGFGIGYGAVPAVPGREFQAFARVPGARQPHRVLAQIPDAFDATKRCLIVTASSGSRGVYGAVGSVSLYGLPRGCAVAHTDKGTGTGFFDITTGEGTQADGTRTARGPISNSSPARRPPRTTRASRSSMRIPATTRARRCRVRERGSPRRRRRVRPVDRGRLRRLRRSARACPPAQASRRRARSRR